MKHTELYTQISVLSILSPDCSMEAGSPVAGTSSHNGGQVRRLLDDFFAGTEIGSGYSVFSGTSGRPFIQMGKDIDKAFSADFNISHSKEALAVFVVLGLSSPKISVGCDIECIRPRVSRLNIAREWFCPQESQWILAGNANERVERFYRIWTAKEAWLKFWGKSIFDISSAPAFSLIPQGEIPCLHFHQFLLQSPAQNSYVLTAVAPFSVSEASLFLGDGWRLRSREQIYAAESPMSTVSPKI